MDNSNRLSKVLKPKRPRDRAQETREDAATMFVVDTRKEERMKGRKEGPRLVSTTYTRTTKIHRKWQGPFGWGWGRAEGTKEAQCKAISTPL